MRKCIQGSIALPNWGESDHTLILSSVNEKFRDIDALTHVSVGKHNDVTHVTYSFKAENMIICKGYEKMLLTHLRDIYGATGINYRLSGDSMTDIDPAINVEV